MDTEGLGSLEASTQHDCCIFALALLLSSSFLYNSVGTISETAIENLSLVVNLTKFIRVKSSADGDEEDGKDFAHYFPKFLWIVRDFTLQVSCPPPHQLPSSPSSRTLYSSLNAM